MSNSLDPDQARHFVVPDLVPNCLKKLSADITKSYFCFKIWLFHGILTVCICVQVIIMRDKSNVVRIVKIVEIKIKMKLR